MDKTIAELIEAYGLKPHPEGGFYRETYRAAGKIPALALSQSFHGDRAFSTAIFYLLPEGSRSLLHRIASDEVFHFYLGGAMTLAQIAPDGAVSEIVMGTDFKKRQTVQHVVPAGSWFGAYPNPGSGYSLVGCTVAPGFDFADFEIGGRAELTGFFPKARTIIERLTQAPVP